MAEARVYVIADHHGYAAHELIPQQPQRQDSLLDQLEELHIAATRLGMYDAADWLWKTMEDVINRKSS